MQGQRTKELDFDFKTFFAVWAKIQGWKHVPRLHLKICDWLDGYGNWENNTGVLQVFRGAGKSTILGCFITYRLVKDPTTRFLILSADYNLSVKITHDLTNIVSNHPLAKHLRGKEKQWRENKLWVNGSKDARTPSAYSIGISSNITGSRSDFVVFDDVEVLNNANNSGNREQLRHKISETVHVLVPGGHRLFVGTPHSHESIYPEVIDSGASSLRVPLIVNPTGDFPNITGESSWPERFTEDEIATRQAKSVSKANFYSQYQLIPYNANDSVLDASLINVYRNESNLFSANSESVLTIGNDRMVSCTCFWDPSLAKASSDDSVLALVYSTADGKKYVHRTLKLTGEAEAQCEQVTAFVKEHSIPCVHVETNGVGGTLPPILRKYLLPLGTSVVGVHSTHNKADKIIEAFEVNLSYGLIYMHNSVMEGPLLSQIRDFSKTNVGRKGYKDDFIDAVASAIKNEPIRITTARDKWGTNRSNWQGGGGSFEAETEGFTY